MADQYVEPGYVERGYVEEGGAQLASGDSVKLRYFITDKSSVSDIDSLVSGWKDDLEDGVEIGVLFAPNANLVSLFNSSTIYKIFGGLADAITVDDVVNSDEFESAVTELIPDQLTVDDVVSSDRFFEDVSVIASSAVSVSDIVNSSQFSNAVSSIVTSMTSSFVTEDRVNEIVSSTVPDGVVTQDDLPAAVESSIREKLVDIVLSDDEIKNNIFSQIVDTAVDDVKDDVSSKALSIITEKLRIANIEIRPSDLSQEIITSFGPSMVEEYDNGSRVEYIIDLPEELVGKKYVIDFHLATSTE